MLDMMEYAESTSVPSQSKTTRRNTALEFFGGEDRFINKTFPIFWNQKAPKGYSNDLTVEES
jgi:hypothetical protein